MKKLTFAPAVLLFAALLFAYGCDCDVQGGPSFANINVCIEAPDGTFFGCVQLDSNAHGVFTPASGTSCGDYSVCGSIFCP